MNIVLEDTRATKLVSKLIGQVLNLNFSNKLLINLLVARELF